MMIVYEMANNHGGSVDLGHSIIDEFTKVKDQFPQFEHCFKFQYRDIPSFIHPTADPNDKYVKRFRETNLCEGDRIALKEHAERNGFLTACTPFDEKSVNDVVAHGYNILKVGSPSFTDWPLWLTVLQRWQGPIIASTGGATVEEIDRVVDSCKGRDLTLMHCVSEYPTGYKNAALGQIDWLCDRYPHIPVGFSSHLSHGEHMVPGRITVFERHVSLYPPPNGYSIVPVQLMNELNNVSTALAVQGEMGVRVPGPRPTQFMRQNFKGIMWWKPEGDVVGEIMELIKKAAVVVPKGSYLELYHHLGMENFRRTGAGIITCFNRDYCKKIIILLPGQYLPMHVHEIKEETFTLLYGDCKEMSVGETLLIEPDKWHSLATVGGAVLEEISTRYLEGDSVYDDERIMENKNRKTKVKEF